MEAAELLLIQALQIPGQTSCKGGKVVRGEAATDSSSKEDVNECCAVKVKGPAAARSKIVGRSVMGWQRVA